MKITLSKNQWEMVGIKSGWMKKEAAQPGKKIQEFPAKVEVWSGTGQGPCFQLIVDNGNRPIGMWTDELPSLHENLKIIMEERYPNLLQPKQPQPAQQQNQPPQAK